MADGYTPAGKITPEWWIRQVARGKQYRRQYAMEDRWPDWRRWYRGQWKPGILPSNVYFKMMRTLIPRVYYRNPSVSITPSKPGLDNMLLCKLLQRADNKLLDIMGFKPQMKMAVQCATMFGSSGIKLGYGAQFTPTPGDISTEAPDVGNRRIRKTVEYNSLVRPNMPWGMAQHPGNLIVPHGSTSIDTCRWVCFEESRTLDDIQADPRFENTKDLGIGVTDSTRLVPTSNILASRDREGVVLWEIRDKKTGKVFVLAPHANVAKHEDKVLYYGDDDLQIDGGLPFYPLIFNPDDEVFWGVPDSQILEPQQIEKNEIRTQIMRHRRIALVKFFAETSQITPDEEAKMIDGNAGAVIKVADITRAPKELPPAQIPAGLLEAEQLIDREVQEMLGLGVNQFGEYAPGSADRSATEASIVNAATQIRIDERRDTCADLLVKFVSDMNHVIIEHWTSEMVLDVVGPAGVQIWIKVQPELFRDAMYDVKVDPDTSLPQTKAIREQKAVQSYEILKDNPLIDPAHLTQWLLNEMYGVDADFLMKNPAMQTSQQEPMAFPDAVRNIGQMPPNAVSQIASRRAA